MKRAILLFLCLFPALLAGCGERESLEPSTLSSSQVTLSPDAAEISGEAATNAVDATGYTDLLCSGTWTAGEDTLICQAGGSYQRTGSAEESGNWLLSDEGDYLTLTLKPDGGENYTWQVAFYEDGTMSALAQDGGYTQWLH